MAQEAGGQDSKFDTEAFDRLRAARNGSLGARLVAVSKTASTNDDALAAARKGEVSGTVYVADEQTRGRGRRGHTWTSPPGENLTFSILLRPRVPVEYAAQLTLVAGAAVRAAVSERLSSRVAVKWPNDVVVERRKLAGILVESQLTGRQLDAVVIGIGVNVKMRALPDELRDIATSLALLGDESATREGVLAAILFELSLRLVEFERQGLRCCLDELRSYDALQGHAVSVEGRHGTACGIDDEGGLLIRDDAGAVHTVTSGTVTW